MSKAETINYHLLAKFYVNHSSPKLKLITEKNEAIINKKNY